MNLETMYAIGKEAKQYGLLYIADIVFALLLQESCRQAGIESSGDDAICMPIKIETRDLHGIYPGEARYDLVYVCYEYSGGRLEHCMPAPLIAIGHLVAAFKRCREPRGGVTNHQPKIKEPSNAAIKALWEALNEQVTQVGALQAIAEVLADTDREGHAFRLVLSNLAAHQLHN